MVVLGVRGFLAGIRGERQEWRRQLSFFDGFLLGPVSSAEAPAEGLRSHRGEEGRKVAANHSPVVKAVEVRLLLSASWAACRSTV